MSSASTHRMFQLRVDPLTGNSEWVVIEEDESTPQNDQKPLLASTSYLDMLNDTRRNRAYRAAIDKTVTKPCHVLDIGAGTGLLSMMAARAMASGGYVESSSSKGTVTACESYLPMVKLMRKVLRVNGMEQIVQIINKRSDELEVGVDISSRADILVSEILDSELLGEGLIPTLQHAHDKLLVQNPQTVPYRATTYGQLVESTHLWKLHDLCNNEAKALDDIQIVPAGVETVHFVKQQQFPMHCDAISEEMKVVQGNGVTTGNSVSGSSKEKLQQKVSPLSVVADDSIFLTVALAQLSKTSHVISLFPGLREKGAQYLQFVADRNGYSMDRIEVLKRRRPRLTMHDTHQKKVDLLIGEPFYYGSDGVLPWQNLRFWNERTMLDSILSKDVLIMPCKGTFRTCAMSLPDLWRSRRCLEEIEGFDHSVVNATLGACGGLPESQESPYLAFSVWQCGEIKKLSEICSVMEFDFLRPISSCSGQAQVEITEPGICHGYALWIDWVMDAESATVISTGPDQRYWKQGVKLLTQPVAVRAEGSSSDGCSSMVLEASFDPSSGELITKHTFS
ncbi:hypothetical protein RJ639_026904 [Escallonia herrerae]|uniref:Protein arginine N-methyltransferase n=1 Tax=Escallonia herrerae TaxID=1293975 RepID=A0AA88X716_9ASTE|nr:hypothetical protein RJ639_026904 [Escallonia herrerae]